MQQHKPKLSKLTHIQLYMELEYGINRFIKTQNAKCDGKR